MAHTTGHPRAGGPLPSVTVIIVNWNAGPLLADCVAHLMRQTRVPEQVLLVDNASTDDSLSRLPAWDRLQVLRMDRNLGFAAGNNRALAQCQTEWVALLNPDAFAEPSWLEALMAAAQQHPACGSFGSRQLSHEDPSRLDGVGDCYHLSGMAWRAGHGQHQTPAHLVDGEIFAPCAAAALYRTSVIRDLGGFDESYFCYLEDVDLGFRLQLAGHPSRYVARAVVHHVGSATTGGQRSDFAVFHGHRNLVWTFVKNMPGALFWALLPLHLVANLLAVAVFMRRGQGSVIWRAKWAALRGLGPVWRARQQVQMQRRAPVGRLWRLFSKGLRH